MRITTFNTAKRIIEADAKPRRRSNWSDAELLPEQFVDRLRVNLATGGLHHLPDEPADRLRIGLRIGDLVGIVCDDLIDDLLDRRPVRHLRHTACLDEGVRVAALAPND